LSPVSTFDEMISLEGITAPGRGDLSSARLEEHLHATVKRLKKLGVRPGVCIASVLPDGPDAITAAMTAKLAHADFVPLARRASLEQYQSLFLKTEPKLLLLHSGAHPAREAARSLGIPIANVLRHFEAGIFTLEADIIPTRTEHWSVEPPSLAWKPRPRGVPVVLIAPGPAYRRLANRLDAIHPVVGITPPSLEHLPVPHTIEHIAAECVRMLRRYRPQGPYALAGLRADALVALEMGRLLEEEGEKVAFVAMLDASSLFRSPASPVLRAFFSALKRLRRKSAPPQDFMTEALRQYHPRPWYGKILHLSSTGHRRQSEAHLEWRDIAPHGIASYEAPAEMLAEPNVQVVATILAAELQQARK
jgi:thioesterase domain-containing protein